MTTNHWVSLCVFINTLQEWTAESHYVV